VYASLLSGRHCWDLIEPDTAGGEKRAEHILPYNPVVDTSFEGKACRGPRLCGVITGFGIGGEYAAINSAIDELIPARYRGRIDLIVNGSFSLGAAAGSGASLALLDPNLLPADLGWRLSFAIGGFLGLGILLLRRHVPESPRWLITHCYSREAEATVGDIEARVRAETGHELEQPQKRLEVHPRRSFGIGLIIRAMLGDHLSRSVLALTLMIAQSFLFNAVYFSYGLVLNRFHGVPAPRTGPQNGCVNANALTWPRLRSPIFKGGAFPFYEIQEVTSNQTSATFTSPPTAKSFQDSGRAKVFAVAGPSRLAAFPDTRPFKSSVSIH
jgi:MFS family permease